MIERVIFDSSKSDDKITVIVGYVNGNRKYVTSSNSYFTGEEIWEGSWDIFKKMEAYKNLE